MTAIKNPPPPWTTRQKVIFLVTLIVGFSLYMGLLIFYPIG